MSYPLSKTLCRWAVSVRNCPYPAGPIRKGFPLLTLRSLLLFVVLCPFLLAVTPDSSPAQEARQRGESMAMADSESSSSASEHRRGRHVSKKRGEHGRDDDDEHDHPGDDDDSDEHEDHDDDGDNRVRPPKAKLKVKNLTRDRQALNWIKLDARKSKGRHTRTLCLNAACMSYPPDLPIVTRAGDARRNWTASLCEVRRRVPPARPTSPPSLWSESCRLSGSTSVGRFLASNEGSELASSSLEALGKTVITKASTAYSEMAA